MKISTLGLAFIARREGLVTKAYRDGKHYSIGFGSNGPQVTVDSVVSVDEAFELLAKDIALRERTVSRAITTDVLQHQFDAILSLYYNAGSGPLAKMAELVNKRWITKAAERFPRYCRVINKETGELEESAGLKSRRMKEQAMFLRADYGDLSWLPFWDGDPFKVPMQKMPIPAKWGGSDAT